jgi:hypothetical protein
MIAIASHSPHQLIRPKHLQYGQLAVGWNFLCSMSK